MLHKGLPCPASMTGDGAAKTASQAPKGDQGFTLKVTGAARSSVQLQE